MKVRINGSWTSFTVSIALMSFFLAFAGLQSSKGNILMIFGGSLMFWLSYMATHKVSVGKFVDGKEVEGSNTEEGKNEKMTPEDTAGYIGISSGVLMCITGITLGSIGIHQSAFYTTLGGAALFILGYIVAHWSTTGKLL